MRNSYLQGRIIGNKYSLPVVIFLTIVCWVVASFIQPVHYSIKNDPPFLCETFLQDINTPIVVKQVSGYLTLALTAYLLIGINNSFAIVRRRTTTQSALYMLMIGLFPSMYTLQCSNLAAPLVVAALYVLLGTYRQPEMTIRHSIATMLLSTSSLLFPPLILLCPLAFIGALLFHSLNLRSFFSGLIGTLLPFWLVFGWLVIDQPDTWDTSIESYFAWLNNTTIPEISGITIVSISFLVVMFIAGFIHIEWNAYDNKNQTLSYLHFFIIMNLAIAIIMFLLPAFIIQWIPIVLIPLSFLTGHLFVLSSGKISNVLFFISMISLITLIVANIWIA